MASRSVAVIAMIAALLAGPVSLAGDSGVCCLPDCTCAETTLEECCLDDGGCLIHAESACRNTIKGTWQGPDTTCDDVTCIDTCTADLDDDGSVEIEDLLALLAQWGTDGPADIAPPAGDGNVGIDDLLLLLAQWGGCP